MAVGPSGVREFESQNPIVGMIDGLPYEETQVHLDRGDRLYLYSDGLVEIPLEGGSVWSHSQFREFLTRDALHTAQPLKQTLRQIMERVDRLRWLSG